MKFTCIVDACSYINLSQQIYSRGTLLNLLTDIATINVSSEVNTEITRHHNSNMPSALKRNNNVYRTKKYTHIEYSSKLFDETPPSADDKGEKDNFAILVDNYLNSKKIGLVYLTDDYKALKGCLSKVGSAFPFYKYWSSYDVILFLYISHKFVSLDMAKDFLRDINSILAVDDRRMGVSKTQQRIQKFKIYNIYLERIQKVTNR